MMIQPAHPVPFPARQVARPAFGSRSVANTPRTALTSAPALARHVTGQLNYLVRPTARLRVYADEPPPDTADAAPEFEGHDVTITDARPLAQFLSLDQQGLAIAQHGSAVRDFQDEAEIRRVYYPEIERLVARVAGARHVLVFDHTVRRAGGRRAPVLHVHVDYTVDSARQRVRDLAGPDADALLTGRFAIINVWRPIRAPLRDMPLAVADASTIAPDQLVPVDLVYPQRSGEISYVTYDPAHRWLYVPEMRSDEVWLFKNYDSDASRPARFAAHSAFEDPTRPLDAAPRESIEVRALVFFDQPLLHGQPGWGGESAARSAAFASAQ